MPELTCDVIMPNQNYGRYLHEAITSALNQVGFRTHVILTDDCSNDNSLEVAKSFPQSDVTVIALPDHVGLPAARNSSVSKSQSPWLGFLDSDDVWPSDRLLRLYEALGGRTDVIAVGNAVEFRGAYAAPDSKRLRSDVRNLNCSLVPRPVFESIGNFDESLQYGDMVDWSARAIRAGVPYVHADSVACWRRVHESNMSRSIASQPSNYLEIVRRHRNHK